MQESNKFTRNLTEKVKGKNIKGALQMTGMHRLEYRNNNLPGIYQNYYHTWYALPLLNAAGFLMIRSNKLIITPLKKVVQDPPNNARNSKLKKRKVRGVTNR